MLFKETVDGVISADGYKGLAVAPTPHYERPGDIVPYIRLRGMVHGRRGGALSNRMVISRTDGRRVALWWTTLLVNTKRYLKRWEVFTSNAQGISEPP